ncbi:MAG: MFS transporter [Acetobacteraceae bacterium]|nr:MFS transporter [Acetobacteraceae bacterium]
MNNPRTVIAFINGAHFIDHYAMLVFAAAVLVMGPALNIPYGDLLPYATPGFIVFGAGSLLTGWLGDHWSRRHMMAVFFLGIGAAEIAVAFTHTPMQLGIALFAVGLFASIYHPVGTAMLISHADKLGRTVGINGVWGNLGVASSAVVTGVICQYLGWRAAFVAPGLITIAYGVLFMANVRHEARPVQKSSDAAARVAKNAMWRVVLALVVTIVASSTTFNAITVALPKLFSERLEMFTTSPAIIGLIAAGVYVFGSLTQYTIGNLIDRHSLRAVFVPLAIAFPPLLYGAANLSGFPFLVVSIGIVAAMFGLVTVNDAMVGKYTSDEWRARAFAVRYFLGFTAAGASVGLVAWLHETGGFGIMLQAFGTFCLLIVLGAIIFPREHRVPSVQPAE